VACDPLSYSGVDASKWASLKDTVSREYGIRIASDRGNASKRGFRLKWAYEPSAQALRIQCLSKPFFVPCGTVNTRIERAAEDLGFTAV
jgi:hypothetical protein